MYYVFNKMRALKIQIGVVIIILGSPTLTMLLIKFHEVCMNVHVVSFGGYAPRSLLITYFLNSCFSSENFQDRIQAGGHYHYPLYMF